MLENLRMSLRLSETLSFEDPFSYPSPNPSHNTYTLNFPSRNRGLYFTTGLLFLITVTIIHYLLIVGKISTPHLLLKKKSINYLAASGLNCNTWDLRSLLQHAGSLAVACGIQFPDQRLNSAPCTGESQPLDHQGSPCSFFRTMDQTREGSVLHFLTVT